MAGNNSLINPLGNGRTLLTSRNCVRWTSKSSDTKAVTGTSKLLFFALERARVRCCPSTTQATLGSLGSQGISREPVSQPASPIWGPLPFLNFTCEPKARMMALGKTTSVESTY